MATPAQIAATARYQKNHTRRFTISCHKKHEADMIAHLEAQGNVTQYLKELIRRDMEK